MLKKFAIVLLLITLFFSYFDEISLFDNLTYERVTNFQTTNDDEMNT